MCAHEYTCQGSAKLQSAGLWPLLPQKGHARHQAWEPVSLYLHSVPVLGGHPEGSGANRLRSGQGWRCLWGPTAGCLSPCCCPGPHGAGTLAGMETIRASFLPGLEKECGPFFPAWALPASCPAHCTGMLGAPDPTGRPETSCLDTSSWEVLNGPGRLGSLCLHQAPSAVFPGWGDEVSGAAWSLMILARVPVPLGPQNPLAPVLPLMDFSSLQVTWLLLLLFQPSRQPGGRVPDSPAWKEQRGDCGQVRPAGNAGSLWPRRRGL